MATLDYALLAEYARIDPAGLVTIVGGSFDRVQASSSRGSQQTYVVMRVLLDESEEEAAFEQHLPGTSQRQDTQGHGRP